MKATALWVQKKIRKRVARIALKSVLQAAKENPQPAAGRPSSSLRIMVAQELAGDSRWFDAHLVMQTIPEARLTPDQRLFSAGLLERMYYRQIQDPNALGWMEDSLRLKLHVCRQKPGDLTLRMATAGTLLVMGKVNQAVSLIRENWMNGAKPAAGDDILLPTPQGVGHLTNLDYLFKMKQLGLISFRRAILPLEPRFRINHEFLSYWIPFGVEPVETGKLQKSEALQKLARVHPDVFAVIHGKVLPMYHAVPQVEKSWVQQDQGPLLRLKETHRQRGWRILEKYGCAEGSWFVTVHVRESGFTGETDLPPNDHRNSNVETFFKAIRFLTAHGGWVIRIGDPTMKRLAPMKNVIDYAHDPNKEEFMDLFLCSENLFYLGTSSGPCMIAPAFGKKCAIANLEIIGGRPFYFGNLFMPKLLAHRKDGRLLSFPEAMARNNKYCFHSNAHYAEGLRFVDNQEDEICAMAEEMWRQATGQPCADPEARVWQDRFDQLGTEHEATYGTNSRISAYFIRKHSHLLA